MWDKISLTYTSLESKVEKTENEVEIISEEIIYETLSKLMTDTYKN